MTAFEKSVFHPWLFSFLPSVEAPGSVDYHADIDALSDVRRVQ